jgi:glycosyltransferase involved in cell wall biosynthesis
MNTKKRILFIGPISPPVTGQSLACDVLIKELADRYNFDIVNLNRDPDSMESGVFRHMKISLKRIMHVAKLKSKCDIIYFTGAESVAGNLKDLLFYLACVGKLNRVVMHLHGGAGMRLLMRGPTGFFRWLNWPFLRNFGAVIVLGERMRDIFRGAVLPQRLKFIANFAEDVHFTLHTLIDTKFDNAGPLQLLFLSNPLPGKGHAEIVEAFARLAPHYQEKLRINFAGRFFDTDDELCFRRAIAPFAELSYLGTLSGEPKRKALANAHVFLLPTYYPYEGQPISILEAFASGCAVVTTDHSGIFDTFTDGLNGYAVEKQSAASLKNTFEKIVDDPEVLRRFAHKNLEHARANFTLQRFLTDIRTVIHEVEMRNN